MPIPVLPRPEIRQDMHDLPNDELRHQAIRYMLELKETPRLGRLLGPHPDTGDLTGCRKIYFDEHPGRSPRYRVIYRLLPNDANPARADVIVIGRRDQLAVYHEAARRLGS
jgi:hypothetical protein